MHSISSLTPSALLLLSTFLYACPAAPAVDDDDTVAPEPPLAGEQADEDWLGSRVIFATAESGATLLGTSDGYTTLMSDYDRGVRIHTLEATTEQDFLDLGASYALDWEEEWLDDWSRQAREVSEALVGLDVVLPDPIYIVAADDAFEFGLAHTRGATIVLPANVLSSYPSDARRSLLAHELFHVLSRADGATRDAAYALLGFDPIAPLPLPSDYEDQRLTNPDAYTLAHAAELDGPDGPFLGAPFLSGRNPLEEAVDQAGLNVTLYVIDADTGEHFPSGDTNYSATVSINTSYDLHPEEALADNFAILVNQRAGEQGDVGRQDLVDSLEEVLSE